MSNQWFQNWYLKLIQNGQIALEKSKMKSVNEWDISIIACDPIKKSLVWNLAWNHHNLAGNSKHCCSTFKSKFSRFYKKFVFILDGDDSVMGEFWFAVSGVMLFNFFFLLLTKVVKWVVGIRAVFWPWVLNQADSKAASEVVLWAGLTRRMLLMRSLASLDTLAKYSSGKLKSPRRILAFVSSKESSRNGESPLRAT